MTNEMDRERIQKTLEPLAERAVVYAIMALFLGLVLPGGLLIAFFSSTCVHELLGSMVQIMALFFVVPGIACTLLAGVLGEKALFRIRDSQGTSTGQGRVRIALASALITGVAELLLLDILLH